MRDRSITHSLQKVSFRQNIRSHSWSVFFILVYSNKTQIQCFFSSDVGYFLGLGPGRVSQYSTVQYSVCWLRRMPVHVFGPCFKCNLVVDCPRKKCKKSKRTRSLRWTGVCGKTAHCSTHTEKAGHGFKNMVDVCHTESMVEIEKSRPQRRKYS